MKPHHVNILIGVAVVAVVGYGIWWVMNKDKDATTGASAAAKPATTPAATTPATTTT